MLPPLSTKRLPDMGNSEGKARTPGVRGNSSEIHSTALSGPRSPKTNGESRIAGPVPESSNEAGSLLIAVGAAAPILLASKPGSLLFVGTRVVAKKACPVDSIVRTHTHTDKTLCRYRAHMRCGLSLFVLRGSI